MAESKKQGMALVQDQLPAYLKNQNDRGRGSEEVGAEDLVIPRLDLVQALSPILKKSDPDYDPKAEQGIFFNSLTRELYGPEVYLVPVFFRKEWVIWKDRKAGGGFRGAFGDPKEAAQEAQRINDAGEGPVEATDTAQQFCLLIHDDGRIEEIVVSMSKSKMKASRNWNSLIRINGGDRFSRVYKMVSFEDQNSNGESYWNVKISNAGFPAEEVYRHAENLYEQIHGGKVTVSVDMSGQDEEHIEEGETAF